MPQIPLRRELRTPLTTDAAFSLTYSYKAHFTCKNRVLREQRGQTLTLDIDLVIFSSVFLKPLSSDIRKENLRFALDTPE